MLASISSYIDSIVSDLDSFCSDSDSIEPHELPSATYESTSSDVTALPASTSSSNSSGSGASAGDTSITLSSYLSPFLWPVDDTEPPELSSYSSNSNGQVDSSANIGSICASLLDGGDSSSSSASPALLGEPPAPAVPMIADCGNSDDTSNGSS